MLKIVETGTREAEDFLSKLMARGKLTDENLLKTVRRTLSDVQAEGDKAVVRYTRQTRCPPYLRKRTQGIPRRIWGSVFRGPLRIYRRNHARQNKHRKIP